MQDCGRTKDKEEEVDCGEERRVCEREREQDNVKGREEDGEVESCCGQEGDYVTAEIGEQKLIKDQMMIKRLNSTINKKVEQ